MKKLQNYLILVGMIILLLPGSSKTKDTDQEAGEIDSRYLAGSYWEVLKERAPKGSLTIYSTGFINGYNYSLLLLKNVLKTNGNNTDVIHSFSDLMMFPESSKPSEIIEIINDFYLIEENKTLPLFVAFTYARQKLSNYPEEFINEYLSETRKGYLK